MLHFLHVNSLSMDLIHYRDRTEHGGRIILVTKMDVLSTLLNADIRISRIEKVLVEIHLRSQKLLTQVLITYI